MRLRTPSIPTKLREETEARRLRGGGTRTLKLLVSATLVIGVAAGGTAVGIERADTIRACVHKGSGALRVTDAAGSCNRTSETPLDWNRAGPTGPSGAPGAGLEPPLWVRTGPGSSRLSFFNYNILESVEVTDQLNGYRSFTPHHKATQLANFMVTTDANGPLSYGSGLDQPPQFGRLRALRICFARTPQLDINRVFVHSMGKELVNVPVADEGIYGCFPIAFEPVVVTQPITVTLVIYAPRTGERIDFGGVIAAFEPAPAVIGS
jgi:hypothetical protein